MRTLLLVAVLLAGCMTIDELSPAKEYIAPDGTRTWSLYLYDKFDKHFEGQTDDELIAQQIAFSRLCENGYTTDRVEQKDDGRIYYGTCL